MKSTKRDTFYLPTCLHALLHALRAALLPLPAFYYYYHKTAKPFAMPHGSVKTLKLLGNSYLLVLVLHAT